VHSLSDNQEKMIAHFFSLLDKDQRCGIDPEIESKSTMTLQRNDPQLDKAIEALKAKVGTTHISSCRSGLNWQ
jgi:hypothetical protein